jgi:hypothetical protein
VPQPSLGPFGPQLHFWNPPADVRVHLACVPHLRGMESGCHQQALPGESLGGRMGSESASGFLGWDSGLRLIPCVCACSLPTTAGLGGGGGGWFSLLWPLPLWALYTVPSLALWLKGWLRTCAFFSGTHKMRSELCRSLWVAAECGQNRQPLQ